MLLLVELKKKNRKKISSNILKFDIGKITKKSTVCLLMALLIAVIIVLLNTFKVFKYSKIIMEMIIFKIKNYFI